MNRMIKLAGLLGGLALAPLAMAQDFVPAETSEAAAQASAAPALAAVAEASAVPFEQQAPVEAFISAEDQLLEFMQSKGWREGWDTSKKRLFVVHSESFNTEDPSYDDSFITTRSSYAMVATLGAKAKMVEFMRTQMSAVDQVTAPGTDVHAELNADYVKLEKKLAAQQRALHKLLQEVNAAEAEKLAGVTWNDRGQAYLDALIKKLDESYSSAAIEEKKLAKYEKAKARYQEALVGMESLEEQAAAIKGAVTLEARSTVETLAKAPLLGAVTLVQAESWDSDAEEYQVATLMVWSPKLEAAATALQTGEPVTLKPKNALSVNEWLAAQEHATLVGPRQYVDQDGRRWFIGAYAMPYEGSASLKRKNKGLAEIQAKKEAAMALYADVETHKKAQSVMQTRSGDLKGKDQTKTATSLEEQTRQSIENRPVSGLSKLMTKTVTHPISGQKVYVVAYGISSDSAAQALQMERSAYNAAAKSNRAISQKNADKQQLDKDLEASRKKVVGGNGLASELPQATPKAASTSKSYQQKSKTASSTLLNAPTIDEDDF